MNHFLQSPTWENYEQLEGHTTFRLESKDFEAMAILNSTPLGNYLYCPYGPILKNDSETSLKSALKSLSDLAKKQNAFFIRIEPTFPSPVNILQSLGLKKSHDLNPAHTWAIDLTKPQEEILKNMRKSNVQYWRSSAKKGLSIHTSQNPDDITRLTSLLQTVSERNHFNPQDETHLKNQLKSGFATLYFAEHQSKTLAASLVYDDGETRFYAHAATSDEERKLAAGIVLLVQMILDAKDHGAKTFDFWGITTSEDKNHPWYGFTQFKKSFGGHEVDYSGTWDLPLNSLRYRLYQIIRKLNRFKRKFIR